MQINATIKKIVTEMAIGAMIQVSFEICFSI